MSRPRIRTLKPEMWADEKVGALSRDARLLFVGLITMADDEGRLRAMLSSIRGFVFPYDEDVTTTRLVKWMDELASCGLIVCYDAGGFGYYALPGWHKHQRITRATRSQLPAPPDHDPASSPPETPRPSQPYRRAIPETTRREVAKRAGGVPGETTAAACHYCGAPGSISWARLRNGKPGSWVRFIGLDLDHVIAAVTGGSGEPSNIVLACPRCNRSKGPREVADWSRDENESRTAAVTEPSDGEVA